MASDIIPNPLVPPGLDVVYADTKLVVINKPSGLLSVPGKGEANQDCVVTRVQAMFPECRKFPSVHRLDMDTSGLLVLGLTARAHRELMQQFHDKEVGKRYVALLDGTLDPALGEQGTIDLPIKRDLDNRPRQMITPEGRRAVTHWQVLAVEAGLTRVMFTPETGRSHQLRLHALHGLGLPIAGDRLYGSGTAPGQLKLHANHLQFTHPKTKERLAFETPPPF